MAATELLNVHFGLVTESGRYLTAEPFGFTVNVAGQSLKRKQVWALQEEAACPEAAAAGAGADAAPVLLRSHLGRFLSADKNGKVSADCDKPGPECRFFVFPQADGRWALQSERYGRYLGLGCASVAGGLAPQTASDSEPLECWAQTLGPNELWAVHLAMHPQVSMYCVGRKRYVRLSTPTPATPTTPATPAARDELLADSAIPWGVDSLVVLEFNPGGAYSLKACDARLLRSDGVLVAEAEPGTAYVIEFKGGRLAFRDHQGHYLGAMGPAGVLRAGRKPSTRPGKDELFMLEDSQPQFVLLACNGRMLSVRQTMDVSANQDEETDTETFQMEIDRGSSRVAFRTCGSHYWALVNNGSIQASASDKGDSCFFDIEWRGKQIAVKAQNGKYVTTKKNGRLSASSDTVGEAELFMLRLVNRPILVLRGEHGFMNAHRGDAPTLHANRSSYQTFRLHYRNGAYAIQGQNQRYWALSEQDVAVCGDEPTDFYLEFVGYSRVAIRAPNGRLVRGDQAGGVRADANSVDADSLWEY
ncbi:fascin isoform X2 [Lethenteron reissneri]|uniref:fascin isoform X2 n=1 Tax=Lethenteron reissneri TaxID=7753 RepID=UPI002AB607DA|nr:fascin isoform X2 [Lethenteron reissneri]